ncbi:hypothetical protein FOCC_FOCC001643, partial [Frankliniella occidentalis]
IIPGRLLFTVSFYETALQSIFITSFSFTSCKKEIIFLFFPLCADGTTDVARTLHFGTPARAHVEAYTRVLQGLVEMSRASVPASMGAHSLDSLARAAVWQGGENYGHPTGHGIGAFLNVHEEPNIFYGENTQRLQVGNFLTAEPGYYKKNDFGVRLENVLEVVEKKSPVSI